MNVLDSASDNITLASESSLFSEDSIDRDKSRNIRQRVMCKLKVEEDMRDD